MTLLFSTSLFLSAFLLFSIQPLVGKLLLPYLGGTPTIWSICLVFFQSVLLAGYGFIHLLTRLLNRFSGMCYFIPVVLFIVVFYFLPVDPDPTKIDLLSPSTPSFKLLSFLARTIAAPTLFLSFAAPLLQFWFSRTTHPDRLDPYFLYAASNLGSALALVLFPFVLEPWLSLSAQFRYWGAGFDYLGVAIAFCAFFSWKKRSETSEAREDTTAKVHWNLRLTWLVLSALPASLLLGVTESISTDIAAVPLLWVIPLFLYLLTFIFAFSGWGRRAQKAAQRAFPLFVVLLITVFLVEAGDPLWLIFPLHLATFFLGALLSHGTLASLRPDRAYLTEFYLWLALGGVLGSAVNTWLAPSVFDRNLEYPLCLIALAFVRASGQKSLQKKDGYYACFVACVAAVLIVLSSWIELPSERITQLIVFGIPVSLVFRKLSQPIVFALSLFALFCIGQFYSPEKQQTLFAERNFFGRLRVLKKGEFQVLLHGVTIHGKQSIPLSETPEPLSYYSVSGPAGETLSWWSSNNPSGRVALVGVGSGALIRYARPAQHWDLIEINPLVMDVASDPRLFTYLSSVDPSQQSRLIGDGRLVLARLEERVDLLILDAFSSDAIPVHLLTQEAFELYRDKLSPKGLLLIHISNRYIDLKPVVSIIAHRLGLKAKFRHHLISEEEKERGVQGSTWILLSLERSFQPSFWEDPSWEKLPPPDSKHLWTDDYSNLLFALK